MGNDAGQVVSFPEQPDPNTFPERERTAEIISIADYYELGNRVMLNRERATTGRDRVDTNRVTREIDHARIYSDGSPDVTPHPDHNADIGRAV